MRRGWGVVRWGQAPTTASQDQEESERFCEWWSRYNVEQALTGQITVRHPDVGIIRIDVIEVKFPAHPGLTMSVHVPARASDQDKIARLV